MSTPFENRHCVFLGVTIEATDFSKSMYTPSETICGLSPDVVTPARMEKVFVVLRADLFGKELKKMLNVKQEKFCVEYLQSGNAATAYKAAFGITNDNAARASSSRLLKNPAIQSRLSELQAQVANEKILSAQEIQERLSAVARREVYETVTLPNGQQVQKPTSIRDATRALELLAKINGMFITRQEVDLQGVLPVMIVDDI